MGKARRRRDSVSSTTASNVVLAEVLETAEVIQDDLLGFQLKHLSSSANHSSNWRRFGTLAFILFHLASWCLVIYGFRLNAAVYNGSECDMTYSVRNYVKVVMRNTADRATPYELYKFIDGRDPRWQSQLRNSDSAMKRNYCSRNPSVVVYVPGHWGSYQQCRSLGAHGTGFTLKRHDRTFIEKQTRGLREGTLNGTASDLEDFVYDTFCIDFKEQGGATHASFLYSQARFVQDVVRQLAHDCRVDHITLVGHSIGGLVAREAQRTERLPRIPGTAPYPGLMKSIITLATPHDGLPYSFDNTLQKIQADLRTENPAMMIQDQMSLISISGGIRDELIPASATFCQTQRIESDNILNFHAPFIMEDGTNEASSSPARLGMDHKAIVWCNNLLKTVHELIFQLKLAADLKVTEDPRMRRSWANSLLYKLSQEESVKHDAMERQYDFEEGFHNSTRTLGRRLEEDYRFLGQIAVIATQIHGATILVGTVALLCGMYFFLFPQSLCHRPDFLMVGLMSLTAAVNATTPYYPFFPLLVLCLVAHSILILVWELVSLCKRKNVFSCLSGRATPLPWILIGILHRSLVFWLYKKDIALLPSRSFLQGFLLEYCLFVWTRAFAILALPQSSRSAHDGIFATLIFLTWPFLFAGKIYATVWSYFQYDIGMFSDDYGYLVCLCLCVELRFLFCSTTSASSRESSFSGKSNYGSIVFLFQFIGCLVVVGATFQLCHRTRGFTIGYFVAALSLIDSGRQFVLRMESTEGKRD